MAQVITSEELKQKIDNKEDFVLVDTLMEGGYEMRHVPGAVSVPYGTNFLQEFEKKVAAPKDKEIIIYCASATCQLSVLAADALEEAGYTNVKHYKEGIAGWQQAGYKFEGERV
ncbi:rhodanese-like domain-containing protein [Patescibacteria group bacterium]|nr:rhodanese-like domain-containing protein [Patescibacteria group bacterium]